ncbi:alpha/beta fold hydrolase [Burkholderia sp. PAMC 26561]|uniref:alpha/beta fold hydrolase n=1 Tax=Burkholderia sp. PAMC 26561 TaxID=1795043 RepID=UPI00076B8620|nr:alpha/beta fold hydrolase [Burkholderia sp. PAMC 26561]AME27342.1 hypothetical protein AXG89_26015 [Burkholderia sp. PAMC 26561]AME27507.1 hypothetical protein AXG89_26675 [Burkholderia sp. PAMC 26561]
MNEWIHRAVAQTFDVDGFQFDSGKCMNVRLYCRTLGSRAPSGDNVVLMLHGTSGSGVQFLQSETADALFGPSQPLDLATHFVILPDAIGHGHSSKPSDGLGARFPKYTYGDLVRAQHVLVTQYLGVNRLRLVLGTSMGGMQTWMWGQAYPNMMSALMPIASLPEKLTGRNLLMRRIMLSMIRPDTAAGHAELGAAWNLFALLVDSPVRLAQQFDNVAAADEHIRTVAATAINTQDVNDMIWEFDASWDYDPASQLGKITAPLLAVNFADDELNPPTLGVLERAILNVPSGRAVTIEPGPGSRGHQNLRDGRLWAPFVAELMRISACAGRVSV